MWITVAVLCWLLRVGVTPGRGLVSAALTDDFHGLIVRRVSSSCGAGPREAISRRAAGAACGCYRRLGHYQLFFGRRLSLPVSPFTDGIGFPGAGRRRRRLFITAADGLNSVCAGRRAAAVSGPGVETAGRLMESGQRSGNSSSLFTTLLLFFNFFFLMDGGIRFHTTVTLHCFIGRFSKKQQLRNIIFFFCYYIFLFFFFRKKISTEKYPHYSFT